MTTEWSARNPVLAEKHGIKKSPALLITTLLVFSSITNASVWYVRPDGLSYGNGTGKSYIDALSGFGEISEALRDGDTVIVCGTHRDTLVITKSNITIRLDCPDDAAVILGSEEYSNAGWSGPDKNGEYSLSLRTRPHVAALDDQILLKGTSGSLASGQWDVAPFDKEFRVYLKDNPRKHHLELGQRSHGIQLGEHDKDIVRGVTILGGGKAWIKYVGASNKYPNYGKGIAAFHDGAPHSRWGGTWIIDGVNFYGMEEQAIHTNGTKSGTGSTPDNLVIKNCRILETGGEAIYVKGVFGGGVIENNTIGDGNYYKSGWDGEGFGSAYDGDGIDLGGDKQNASQNFLIKGNKIINIRGTGIVASAGNVTIAENWISNVNAWNEPVAKACIYVDPVYRLPTHVRRNYCSTDHSDGIQVRGSASAKAPMEFSANLVLLNGEADNYAVVRHNSFNVSNTGYFNNTFVGGRYGFYWSSKSNRPESIKIFNNILHGQPIPFCLLQKDASGVLMSNNLFMPQVGSTSNFVVGQRVYSTLTELQSAFPSMRQNIIGDPLFLSPQQGDYRLSAKSPARRTGKKWWLEESPRDLSGLRLPDIGINLGALQ